ncbi:MAG: DUF72 domain-containing protein [Thermoplasmata archaeon]|nr:DUF72 domain-containing protein [Thermoplasmata archaeon]
MGEVVLGTSGWDYPEWVGPVYPRHGTIDRLRFYTDLFPIVEVNSTFYRLPRVSVAESWARRTPRRFRFAAKFPQTITHERRLVGAEEELGRFLEVLSPLRDAGKFAAALLQLPPSLAFDPANVRAFYERLPADLPVAVEFREPSWRSAESFDLLREFRLAYVVVDEPFLPIDLEVTASFSYIRWHGRGEQLWYDYTYSKDELTDWVPKVRALEERSEHVYGFFNNHFRGDAAVNAQGLTEQLGLPPPPWSSKLDR